MPKFDVIIRGPNGFFESGQYESAFRKTAFDATKDILNDLVDHGYVRLEHVDGSSSVVFKGSVMSFSVNPNKELAK